MTATRSQHTRTPDGRERPDPFVRNEHCDRCQHVVPSTEIRNVLERSSGRFEALCRECREAPS